MQIPLHRGPKLLLTTTGKYRIEDHHQILPIAEVSETFIHLKPFSQEADKIKLMFSQTSDIYQFVEIID